MENIPSDPKEEDSEMADDVPVNIEQEKDNEVGVESEFTTILSRGRLRHPSRWLFRCTQLCYACFLLNETRCSKRMKRLFSIAFEFFS